jgi:hypothetical protein
MARITKVLNFEGLGANEAPVANGYGGLTWTGANVYTPEETGFGANGVHSGESVIYNENAQPLEFSSHKAFGLKLGFFSAAQEDHVLATFTGLLHGEEVAHLTVDLNQELTRVKFAGAAWSHLDQVTISTDNEVNPSYSQITIDDLKLKVHQKTAPPTDAQDGVSDALHHQGQADLHLTHEGHGAYDAGGLIV